MLHELNFIQILKLYYHLKDVIFEHKDRLKKTY